ncbi:MAG: Smr/MutS family protein [Firmicutes bacterium]|nr:Smr/MutS family protein [Bacillota bacterium]
MASADLATAGGGGADAEQLKAKLDAARREWEARRDERLEQARAQARAVLDRARREADRLLSDIRRYHRQAELKKARQARAELQARMAELDAAASATGTPDIPAGGPVESPEPGQTVLVSSLAQVGTVLQRPDGDGHVTVQIGGLRVRVPVKDLRAAPARQDAEAAGRPPARQTGAVLAAEKRAAVSPEVHLRGMTVDEALAVLEKYLDDAVLAGLSAVRVIHGKGTGTLRRAIQDYLRGHPAVESWRLADTSAGGAGVTVVELRS